MPIQTKKKKKKKRKGKEREKTKNTLFQESLKPQFLSTL